MEAIREKFVFALKIGHVDSARVVANLGVFEKRDLLSVGGDARMTDPTGSFVDHLSDGKFEAVLAAHVADDG